MEHTAHPNNTVATVCNLKERKQLDKVTKYYDKCREKAENVYNHERKDLQRQLARLKQECHTGSSHVTIDTTPGHSGVKLKIVLPSNEPDRAPSSRPSATDRAPGSRGPRLPPNPSTMHASFHLLPPSGAQTVRRHSLDVAVLNPEKRRSSLMKAAADGRNISSHDVALRHLHGAARKEHERLISLSMTDNLRAASTHSWQDALRRDSVRATRQTPPDHAGSPPSSSSGHRLFPDLRHNSLSSLSHPVPPDFRQSHGHFPKTDSKTSKPTDARRGSRRASHSEHYVHRLSERALQQYTQLMDAACGKTRTASVACPVLPRVYGPVCTGSQRGRKKMLAFELMLRQLARMQPQDQEFDPAEMLACRYLRLSNNNIDTLTQMCRDAGVDVTVHPHMKNPNLSDALHHK